MYCTVAVIQCSLDFHDYMYMNFVCGEEQISTQMINYGPISCPYVIHIFT